MDKKILVNYIYNIAYQLVKIALPLVTVPYLYAHVGAETLGISDFASNIAVYIFHKTFEMLHGFILFI